MSKSNLIAYTDGSFNNAAQLVGASSILYVDEQPIILLQRLKDKKYLKLNQIAGEIRGALNAIKFAIEHGYKKITIYHDYNGLGHWVNGDWAARKPFSKYYLDKIHYFNQFIDIKLIEVTGHSDNKGNNLADFMAKLASNLEPTLPEEKDMTYHIQIID